MARLTVKVHQRARRTRVAGRLGQNQPVDEAHRHAGQHLAPRRGAGLELGPGHFLDGGADRVGQVLAPEGQVGRGERQLIYSFVPLGSLPFDEPFLHEAAEFDQMPGTFAAFHDPCSCIVAHTLCLKPMSGCCRPSKCVPSCLDL